MHKYHGVIYFTCLGLALLGFFLPSPYSYVTHISIITYAVLRLTILKDEKTGVNKDGIQN